MQRAACARGGWSHWTGGILPVLCFALLTVATTHAGDKHQKDDAGGAATKIDVLRKAVLPGQEDASRRPDPPRNLAAAGKEEPPRRAEAPKRDDPPGRQDPPKPAARVLSMDRVVKQIEKKYKARVVRTDKQQRGDRLVYELKVLSDERLRTVRVDAETGEEL